MQQEVEASRSSNACCGFAGVEIKDEGKVNERWCSEGKKEAWRCNWGLRRGSKPAYQGATTHRWKPSKRAAALFFELFAVSGAPMLTYTHTHLPHTHTTLATLALTCLFLSSALLPSTTCTHPLTHSYCVRAQLGTSGSGNTAAATTWNERQWKHSRSHRHRHRLYQLHQQISIKHRKRPLSSASSSATTPYSSSGHSALSLAEKRARTGVVAIEVAPLLPTPMIHIRS